MQTQTIREKAEKLQEEVNSCKEALRACGSFANSLQAYVKKLERELERAAAFNDKFEASDI